MESLLFYFLKVILCSGVMFLYYQLFLKDRTFHHYNRFYLLGIVLVSLLLPLVKIDYFTLEVNNDIYLLLSKLESNNYTKTLTYDYIYYRTGYLFLGLVAVFFLAKFLIGIFQIRNFKNKYIKDQYKGINFYQTDLANAPFSFFRDLFWKESIAIDSKVGQQILKHELIHIEQKHSWDNIFLEIVTSLFWFNPVFYLIKKEIYLIHEYLADHKTVKHSDTKAFANMLLVSQFSDKTLSITSPFLSSNLKKRINMLQKSKTKFSYARKILALPLVFAIGFAYLVNAKNKEIIETNKSIEIAVKDLKADTIINGKTLEEIVEQQRKNIEKEKEKIKLQQENLEKLSNKAQIKSEELNKISKEQGADSYAYKEKEKEIIELSKELDLTINKISPYSIFPHDIIGKDTKKLEKVKALLYEKGYNFDSLIKIKDFKQYINGKIIPNKNINSGYNSEFESMDNVIKQLKNRNYNLQDIDFTFKNIQSSKLTPKQKRALEKAQKQAIKAKAKADVANVEAEIYRKEAEKMKKELNYSKIDASQNDISIDYLHSPWIITSDAISPPKSTIKKEIIVQGFKNNKDKKPIIISKTFHSNPQFFKDNTKYNDIELEIDGKRLEKKELHNIDPEKIESVNIIRNSDKNIIKIKTKK